MIAHEARLSLVLPVHNQADHIAELVEGFHAALTSLASDVEIICVVNASHDDSAVECRRVAGAVPGVVVVEDDRPGWGRAVRSGLATATGDLLGYTNSARTTPADLRTAFVRALEHEGTVVKAVRRFRDGLLRRAGSVLYNLEARALFGLASWDINGTPKVFPRRCGALLGLEEDGDLIDLEFLVVCRREGYDLIEFPVTSVARHGGTSTTGVRSALRMYAGALGLRRRLREGPA